jgi:hypothetical protein
MSSTMRRPPSPRRAEELRAEARHHRERRDLYRAKVYGPRATSSARLRELERIATVSERRARRSEEEVSTARPSAAGAD